MSLCKPVYMWIGTRVNVSSSNCLALWVKVTCESRSVKCSVSCSWRLLCSTDSLFSFDFCLWSLFCYVRTVTWGYVSSCPRHLVSMSLRREWRYALLSDSAWRKLWVKYNGICVRIQSRATENIVYRQFSWEEGKPEWKYYKRFVVKGKKGLIFISENFNRKKKRCSLSMRWDSIRYCRTWIP